MSVRDMQFLALAAPSWLVISVPACAAIAAGYLYHRCHSRYRRLATALNNMSQGLCMFDAGGRLIAFNQPYLKMYGLSKHRVKPGCTLRDLLEQRMAAGTSAGDPDRYIADLLREVVTGKPVDK